MLLKLILPIFLLILLSDQTPNGPQLEWFDSLVKYLSANRHIKLAVILEASGMASDFLRDDLFRTVINTMPTYLYELSDNPKITKMEENDQNPSPLSSSHIFMYFCDYSGDNEDITHVLPAIRKRSQFAAKSHFIITLKTSSAVTKEVEDILRAAWKVGLVDLLIVEIRVAPKPTEFTEQSSDVIDGNDTDCRKIIEEICMYKLEDVMIHQFNPFRNMFFHKKLSDGIELFPNFAKDLYGHQLNISTMNQPPLSFISYEKNGSITEPSGANIVLVKSLAEDLNFTIFFTPKGSNVEKKLNHYSEENILDYFEQGSADIFAHAFPHATEDIREESMRSLSIWHQTFGVLMPTRYGINNQIIDDTMESSGLTLIIVLVFWFAVIILRFDHKIWHFSVIVQLLLSLPVSSQPSASAERALFFIIVLLGFIYSNDIYASLTNFAVNSIQEIEYTTFEEIESTGLIPIIRVSLFKKTFKYAKGALLELMNKTISVADNSYCPEVAMAYRNVCCLMDKSEGDYYRQLSQTSSGLYRLTFAKAILWNDNGAFMVKKSSPYMSNIDEHIQRYIEGGLIKSWYENFGEIGLSKIFAEDQGDSPLSPAVNTTRNQMLIVIIFGLSVAFVVFGAEVIVHRFKDTVQRQVRIIFRRLLRGLRKMKRN